MGKSNIKKSNLILFSIFIAIGLYGCSIKQTDNSALELASQVETSSSINELSVQVQTSSPILYNTQSTSIASAYSSAIIRNFGSYQSFEKSILDNINVIRAQYGYCALTTEWHAETIAQAISEISASINNPTHLYAYDYPAIAGMYRNEEACLVGFELELLDPSFVAEQLTNYNTESVVTDSDNIYVGIGLKAYGDKIAIVIDTYNKSDFNNYIIGSQKIVETDTNGTQYLNKSIWAEN